jgi:FMN phosphatase YigB (HAD superfamily)
MKYILDFDGVILDIQALKNKMEDLGIPLTMRTKETFQSIKDVDTSFDLRTFLFTDAISFIKKNAKDCIIVSSYVSISQTEPQDAETAFAFQLEKIILSGVKELGIKDIRVVGIEKKYALADIQNEFGQECLFVDDRKQYINEAEELGIKAFFMNRKKALGSFESPLSVEISQEIGSFMELEEKLK